MANCLQLKKINPLSEERCEFASWR